MYYNYIPMCNESRSHSPSLPRLPLLTLSLPNGFPSYSPVFLVVCKSCGGDQSCYVFWTAMALLYPEDSTPLNFLLFSGFYNPPAPPSMMLPRLGWG